MLRKSKIRCWKAQRQARLNLWIAFELQYLLKKKQRPLRRVSFWTLDIWTMDCLLQCSGLTSFVQWCVESVLQAILLELDAQIPLHCFNLTGQHTLASAPFPNAALRQASAEFKIIPEFKIKTSRMHICPSHASMDGGRNCSLVTVTSWWFQLISTICSSNWINSSM